MTPEKDNQPIHWTALIGAIALSWSPVVLFLGLSANKDTEPKAMAAAAIGAAVVIAIYLLSRKRAWSLILWVPLVLFAAVGGITLLGLGLSTPTSGPDAAPLEGVAVLMMLLIAAGFGAVAIVGGVLRPKALSVSMLMIGSLNSASMLVAASNGYRGATKQEIVIHLRHPSGTPLSGVAVKYERYGYGAGGHDVFDGSGGPVYSNQAGIVTVPSRRMRYETRVTISKQGFREVTLVIPMQLSEHDKTRRFVLSTYDTRAIASGSVPATDPVHLSLYLSPVSDSPSPELRRLDLYSQRDLSREVLPKSLGLQTGKFTADLSGDLELEFFSATKTRFRDRRLRIRGLNGVQVCLADPHRSGTTSEPSYEDLYRFAPLEGYEEEVLIENPGDSPGPAVYVRAADGRLHGCLHIKALGDGLNEVPRYRGTLLINPYGRHLE